MLFRCFGVISALHIYNIVIRCWKLTSHLSPAVLRNAEKLSDNLFPSDAKFRKNKKADLFQVDLLFRCQAIDLGAAATKREASNSEKEQKTARRLRNVQRLE